MDSFAGLRNQNPTTPTGIDRINALSRAPIKSLGAEQDSCILPDITCPGMQFHCPLDRAVDKDGLNNTWNWITEGYTLATAPRSGYFVQRAAADLVSDTT
jgi:hypothetical protein